ncbi:hypothetical protein OL229_07460 [Neisseriaceae bacterium JH1-16]|nr:hypothetical protein [Neisseriaceae bacterium JH1-16]
MISFINQYFLRFLPKIILCLSRSILILLLFLILTPFQYSWAAASKPEANQYDDFSISSGSDKRVAWFRFPKSYKSEFYGESLRIVVDYPSMSPTTGRRRFQLNKDALEIVITNYPKIISNADSVITGKYGAKLIGTENGYDLYQEPIGKGQVEEIRVYKTAEYGYVAISDPGSWSYRFSISYALKNHYEVTAYYRKDSSYSLKDVQKSVADFIEKYRVKN